MKVYSLIKGFWKVWDLQEGSMVGVMKLQESGLNLLSDEGL